MDITFYTAEDIFLETFPRLLASYPFSQLTSNPNYTSITDTQFYTKLPAEGLQYIDEIETYGSLNEGEKFIIQIDLNLKDERVVSFLDQKI